MSDSESALSALFVCLTSPLTLDPSHRPFRCCVATSVAHGFVVASIEVFCCELLCLDGLLYVISGILAGFRILLCCFTHTAVWQCDFGVFVSLFSWFCHTNT